MAPQRTRPGRPLAFVLVAVIALYAGLFFGKGGHARTPLLGTDLRGGTQVTLTASPEFGQHSVSQQELNTTVSILDNRVNGAGVEGASIHKQGSDQIVVTAPGQGRGLLDLVSRAAVLSFRQVLEERFSTPQPTPSTSVSPSPGSTSTSPAQKQPKAKVKATGKPKNSGQKDVLFPALLRNHGGQHTAKSTITPSSQSSGSASTTPSTGTSGTPSPTTTSSGGGTTTTGKVLHNKGFVTASPTLADVEATYNNSKFTCPAVDGNPTNGTDISGDYMLACYTFGGTTFVQLLAPSSVTPTWSIGGVKGVEISSASSGPDPTTAGQYDVTLNFKSTGAGQWQQLTAAANKAPALGGTGCSPPTGCNSVAIVLDGVVRSAPQVTQQGGIAGGQTQITGNFTQGQASQLADVLKYGSLPVKLTAQNPEFVSPSLGSKQLTGGLIAGVISLVLVALFCLIYYRALGLVAIASLILSGLILYSVTTLLGHSRLGYTLTLAGIAGFIVAVGITADSFVVFFERLRDEAREGKRLRSGVERAWPRARRTIISADAVSLLAAVILYIVSISDVRGFAFTLGLSTLSDLFIVFFFTKPLLTWLARWRGFDSGAAWTGMGRSRMGHKIAVPGVRGTAGGQPAAAGAASSQGSAQLGGFGEETQDNG